MYSEEFQQITRLPHNKRGCCPTPEERLADRPERMALHSWYADEIAYADNKFDSSRSDHDETLDSGSTRYSNIGPGLALWV